MILVVLVILLGLGLAAVVVLGWIIGGVAAETVRRRWHDQRVRKLRKKLERIQ